MAREYARFPRLAERRARLAGSLSGGEQQMLAIARGLVMDALLVMDEPSLGLAPIVVDEIMDAVRRLHEEGVTVLLVEQAESRLLGLPVGSPALVVNYTPLDPRGRALLTGRSVSRADRFTYAFRLVR